MPGCPYKLVQPGGAEIVCHRRENHQGAHDFAADAVVAERLAHRETSVRIQAHARRAVELVSSGQLAAAKVLLKMALAELRDEPDRPEGG
jgi:hypothetical protein